MNRKFFQYLIDPVDGSKLRMMEMEVDNEDVISGILFSKTSWYPIIDGVPRMLTGELRKQLLKRKYAFYKKFHDKLDSKVKREWSLLMKSIKDVDSFLDHQKRTSESFSFEWKNIYKENDFEEKNFFHFLSPFISKVDLKGKVTVDIGCGSGRFTKWAAKSGTKVSFGTDLGDTVEVAYRMNKDLDNVAIVQADIYNMPFSGVFDIAYSIGVLHHLPRPKDGFLSLIKLIKKGGIMLIWVYNRRNNKRAIYFYEPLRTLTRIIPKKVLLYLCYIPALIVHFINIFSKIIGWTKAPFYYYSNFPFNMKLNDAFDVLATPKSNYYYVEEIEGWFKSAKLNEIKSFEHKEAGITCVGKK